MARNPRQAALYEVINRSRFRDAQQKALERIGVVKEPVQTPEPVTQVVAATEVAAESVAIEAVKTEPVKAEVSAKSAKPEKVWTGRQKPIRFYPDRIEICFSWQVAGISLLALIAIFLVFFRLGQMNAGKGQEKTQQAAVLSVADIKPNPPVVVENKPRPIVESTPRLVEPMGENAIVITSYDLSSHLEPVKTYFAQYGIATEIIKRGSRYLLVTQNRYDNIEKAGTDGNEMKKKIMSVGASYKAPAGSGFESFGTKPFQDVYGMKIK
ncbi:MAG: hypothetical protein A2Y10_12255 [Planctomycetes bacterium GWF2_41_51]|nr:MAG: hypothetical protein A2Y10_12255 [Planctomycetes bacterium GWF2_41_51]HBG28717.1 hypothetical protein [Phycisphaerales bacterium]